MSETLVICDIDGVLANCEHRLKYLRMKDYDTFYGVQMADDSKINAGFSLLKSLRDSASDSSIIYYATGRPERTRNLTLNWLEAYLMPQARSDRLYMRKDVDYRPSPELKVEQVEQILKDREVIGGYNLIGWFKAVLAAVTSIITGEKEQPPTVYFIDDDPENVKAVCGRFPFITGITFGVKRMEEKDDA